MNVQLLVDFIVQQTTVLIAQLATSGGIRAPVAHIANQVFLELANELESQGVSRKVSADMFGMALRAYVRKVRRLSEGQTERGRTLWQSVIEFIKSEELVRRERIVARFERDGDLAVSAVLRDLIDSGLVFCTGGGKDAVFRAATDAELGRISELDGHAGVEEFAWALIFRNGPIAIEKLAELLKRDQDETSLLLTRLEQQARVSKLADGRYHAQEFVIPLGASAGWEAAVFDHFQAVVQTICQRLRASPNRTDHSEPIGGSTFTFDTWVGHPLENEVKGILQEMRLRLSELRQRVEAVSRSQVRPENYQQIVTYVGQCVLERDIDPQDGDS